MKVEHMYEQTLVSLDEHHTICYYTHITNGIL